MKDSVEQRDAAPDTAGEDMTKGSRREEGGREG